MLRDVLGFVSSEILNIEGGLRACISEIADITGAFLSSVLSLLPKIEWTFWGFV